MMKVMLPILFAAFFVSILFGIMLAWYFGAFSTNSKDYNSSPVNKLPNNIKKGSESEMQMLAIYQSEWKTIIETQMHFNDLIIRFRSIVLTAFITLIGASIALKGTDHISKVQALIMLGMIATLWVTAFVMDYGYYHRLLLGSVHQALKYDDSEIGRQYGLFGLTTCISQIVHPPTSKAMVAMFYGIPGAGIVVVGICVLIMESDFL